MRDYYEQAGYPLLGVPHRRVKGPKSNFPPQKNTYKLVWRGPTSR